MKGDLARAMFYMDIRYEGGGSEPNLTLTDNVALISASNTNMGRLSTLLVWNFLDAVSPAERTKTDTLVRSEASASRRAFFAGGTADKSVRLTAQLQPSPLR